MKTGKTGGGVDLVGVESRDEAVEGRAEAVESLGGEFGEALVVSVEGPVVFVGGVCLLGAVVFVGRLVEAAEGIVWSLDCIVVA